MATYVNDLRLKEIATGESAGTWGTETNVNLELIAEAMGHGSEAIANASTHTITMQDGVSDEFRSTFLRLTGGGQACTVTLAPNTLSHTWIMRNETNSTLTLTQGSGANVAISAGQTKIVTTDGAGSGAVVYEMDDLELAGNIAVGGNATVTGDIDVDGTVEFDALSGTGSVAVTDIADEDNMSSNSATKLATQQSIKAYVDSQVGTVDTLAEILANGNTTGGTDIAVGTGDDITFADSSKAIFGAGSDLNIFHDGSNSFISEQGTGDLYIGASNNIALMNAAFSENKLLATTDGALKLYFNGSQKLATASGGISVTGDISNASGDLTIDVAGDIILDADGGDIILKDGGTSVAEIDLLGGNLIFSCLTSDEDILFKGNDGGSTIDALTLDMSAAGAATFNSSVTVGSNMGNFIPVTSGTTGASLNANGNGLLQLQSGGVTKATINDSGVLTCDGGVVVDELTIDADTITATDDFIIDAVGEIVLDADNGGQVHLKDGGTEYARFFQDSNRLFIQSAVSDADILIRGNDGGSAITALTLNMSEAGEATFNSDILLGDGKVARFGTDQDFRIGFDGSTATLQNVTSDSDITFIGKDGSSTITALTLDMSAAGAATFNGNLTVNGADVNITANVLHSGDSDTYFGFNANDSWRVVTGNEERLKVNNGEVVVNDNSVDMDFRVESNNNANMLFVDGGNDRITIGGNDGTGSLHVKNKDNSGSDVHVVVQNTTNNRVAGYKVQDESGNTAINLKYDNGGNNAVLESAIGDLTLDVVGDIILDADSGAWRFKDNGGSIIELSVGSGSSPTFYAPVANADIIFKGNDSDGSNPITALTLDMSDFGGAIFNSHVTIPTIAYVGQSIVHNGDADTSIDFATNTMTLYTGGLRALDLGADFTVFNTNGADVNFRVESSGNANMLFIDGGEDHVNIGTASDFGDTFNVSGTGHFSSNVTLSRQSNDTGSTGLILEKTRNTSVNGNTVVQNGDQLGYVAFRGNDGDQFIDGAYVISFVDGTPSNNDMPTSLQFWTTADGASSPTNRFSIAADGSLSTPTAGTSNVRFGVNAGNSIASGGNFNTVVGDEAGTEISTGDANSFFGYQAGAATTTSSDNTAIGGAALATNILASSNTAIGKNALFNHNVGSAASTYNTAVGHHAGLAITTGIRNTLIGALAGDALTDADFNVAVGSHALTADTLGSKSIAIGHSALEAQNFTSATDVHNIAIGDNAGAAITTGTENTLIGGLAGDALTTGQQNVALGYAALSADDVGNHSVAIGTGTLQSQNYGSATNSYNTAVGSTAGAAVTTGIINTFIGAKAGTANLTASSNVAVGYDSLGLNTKGAKNVAVGESALYTFNVTSDTDTYNTAVGHHAGVSVTTGIENTIVGGLAGDALTDADYNVALGAGALGADTLGSRSTAVGYLSLFNQNFTSATNSNNTAIGYAAGTAVTTGIKNTFMGALAGDATQTGEENVAVGYQSLSGINGDANTACGSLALSTVTGDSNTGIGRAAGFQITSGSNNIAIGLDALRTGSPGGAQTTASNKIGLGDENITSAHIQVDWTVASDARDKTDFTALDLGLDFVKDLQPVTYKWDKRAKYGDKYAEDYDLNAQTPDGTHKEDWLDIGFKAQEVEALEIAAGYNKDNNTNLVSSHSDDGKQMGLQYSKFVPILVKAIQEQQALIESLTARIETLEG